MAVKLQGSVDYIHLYVCAVCTPISPLRKVPLLSVCSAASRFIPRAAGAVAVADTCLFPGAPQRCLGARAGDRLLVCGWVEGKRTVQMRCFYCHHIPPCIGSLYQSFGALSALTEK